MSDLIAIWADPLHANRLAAQGYLSLVFKYTTWCQDCIYMVLVSIYKEHFYCHNCQSALTTNPPGSNHGSLGQSVCVGEMVKPADSERFQRQTRLRWWMNSVKAEIEHFESLKGHPLKREYNHWQSAGLIFFYKCMLFYWRFNKTYFFLSDPLSRYPALATVRLLMMFLARNLVMYCASFYYTALSFQVFHVKPSFLLVCQLLSSQVLRHLAWIQHLHKCVLSTNELGSASYC